MSFLLKKLKLVSFLTLRILPFGFAQWKRGIRGREESCAAMEFASVVRPGLSVIVDVGAHVGIQWGGALYANIGALSGL